MKIRRGLIAGVAAMAAVTVCAEQKKPNILFMGLPPNLWVKISTLSILSP